MLKKLRENKKGFTLVELIVVLVILGILAALLVPALTGYIDKAKEKSIIAETRQVVIAAQTLADEEYAKIGLDETATKKVSFANAASGTGGALAEHEILFSDVEELAEVGDFVEEITAGNNGKIETVKYKRNGKTCTYSSTTKQYTLE